MSRHGGAVGIVGVLLVIGGLSFLFIILLTNHLTNHPDSQISLLPRGFSPRGYCRLVGDSDLWVVIVGCLGFNVGLEIIKRPHNNQPYHHEPNVPARSYQRLQTITNHPDNPTTHSIQQPTTTQ